MAHLIVDTMAAEFVTSHLVEPIVARMLRHKRITAMRAKLRGKRWKGML